jgi:uncharacterized OB-fold protein
VSVRVQEISIYRPAWTDSAGQRVLGHDEDETTAAVAAIRGLSSVPDRIVLVSQAPQFIEGDTAIAIAAGVGAQPIHVERRLGGADAVIDAMLSARPGTAVVAVQIEAPAVACAVLVGERGASLRAAGTVAHSLPARMRAIGDDEASVYDDPRLLRERGWRPAVEALSGDRQLAVVGVLPAYARSVDALSEIAQGPVAALAGLAAVVSAGQPVRLIGVHGASAAAVDIDGLGDCTVAEVARDPLEPEKSTTDHTVDIPISLAAYERAFDAKLRLEASQCSCGTLEFPPRAWCSECGRPSGEDRVPLPRSGSVYTTASVRIPVPGVRSPYSIAIVGLDGLELRVLAPVTDAHAGSAAIGDRGLLVLRRVAVRKGIPDYGYSFQPESTVRPHAAYEPVAS